MRLRLIILVVVMAAVAAAPAFALSGHTTKVAAKLGKQIKAIKKHRHPAILVPTSSNAAVYKAKQLFGSGGRISGGYDLELGKGRTCNGTHFCQQGTFVALRGGKLDAGGKKVTLRGGIRGRFLGVRCGASCSAPRLVFRRKGVLYDFEWVVPRGRNARNVLVALANGALKAGPR